MKLDQNIGSGNNQEDLKKQGKELLKDDRIKEAAIKAVQSGDAEKLTNTKLTKSDKNKVIEKLYDSSSINVAPEKKEDFSSHFTSALAGFIPLIATGIGALVGGADTAAAALEGSAKGLQAGQAYDISEREMALKERAFLEKQKPESITPYQEQALKLREKEIQLQQGMEQRRVKQYEEVTKPAFGLKQEQVKQLSDKQVESLKNLEQVQGSIDRIRALKQRVNTGPVESRVKSIGEATGVVSQDFTQLKSEVNNLVADYIRAISGAQASEKEASRLQGVVPTINDQDNQFGAKLDQFEKIMNNHRQAIAESIASNQPLKKDTVQAILKDLSEQPEPQQQAHSRAGQLIKYQGKEYLIGNNGELIPR